MKQRTWNIGYKSKDGKAGIIIKSWPSEPTKENAAILVREDLLGKNYLLVDTPRGHPEPTVFFLISYGFEITGIEEAQN